MGGDLRGDSRTNELLTADPGLCGLAGMLQRVAELAQNTSDGLRGTASEGIWSGSAADAFRQGVGKLPGDLAKVTASYQEAGDALNVYVGELNRLQPEFRNILSQLDGAQSHLSSVQSQLTSAQSAQTPSVPLSSPLHTTVNAANGAVQNAQAELDGITARGLRLLDEFDTARVAAKGRVSHASHVPPHRSFWDHVFHDVGNWLGDVGHFVVDTGKGIFDSVTGTWGALQAFANDPSLANFGKLASDLAVDASIVVLIAAAPEALGLVGAAEAATEGAAAESVGLAARIASMGAPAETVATNAGAAKAAADLLQRHYANFALDELFVNLPTGDNVANAIGAGDHAAEAAATTAENLKMYQGFIDHGVNPSDLTPHLTDGELKSVLDNVSNLGDPASVASATQNATAAAAHAAKTAGRIGAPLAYGADSLKDHGQDKVSEKLKELLHPEPAPACP